MMAPVSLSLASINQACMDLREECMSERFEDVVRNAFDFLKRSINELEHHPKFSVIHFYTAIELIVKARLLKEHWSLIVARPEQADMARFQRGDFQSVGLPEANDRLKRVANDGLMEDEFKCFDGLRQVRNQMVHFAHVTQGDDENSKKEMDRIVSDHAKGWLYLQRLLTGRWKKHYIEYAETIKAMDKLMLEQTKSLERKFLLLSDQIEDARAAGSYFMCCPSCRFESFEVDAPVWVGIGKCRTCGLSAAVVALECIDEDCVKPILLVGGHEHCPECGHRYTPEEVASVLDDNDKLQDTDPFDPGDVSRASCGNCDGYDTVVPLRHDGWLCTDCFDIEEHIDQCDYCTGHSTHVPEDSFLNGCSQCDGRLGDMGDE
jgi:hypothetical protein